MVTQTYASAGSNSNTCTQAATGSASLQPRRGDVFVEPGIGALDPRHEGNAWPPAQGIHPRNVQQLARSAVGLARIEFQISAKAHHRGDHVREFAYRDILAPAHIDDFFSVIVAQHEDHGI